MNAYHFTPFWLLIQGNCALFGQFNYFTDQLVCPYKSCSYLIFSVTGVEGLVRQQPSDSQKDKVQTVQKVSNSSPQSTEAGISRQNKDLHNITNQGCVVNKTSSLCY